MKPRALIVGGGIAGLSCAQILAMAGWNIEVCGEPSASSSALMLNDVTCHLLQDIWRDENNLFRHSHSLHERRVCWGSSREVSVILERSLVIQRDALARNLAMLLARRHSDSVRLTNTAFQTLQSAEPKEFRRYLREQKYLWVIDASGRGVQFAKILGGVVRRSYGRRCVIGTEALLVRESDRNTCWIESLPNGWLFLAPMEDGHAALQAMVSRTPADPSSVLPGLLEQSMMREICVINSEHPVQSFDAAPQISEPLCGPGWIAIGEAAVSLDPVCGDGVGYATRGAALAAGVINGIGSGLSPEDCFSHYRQRLCNTFSAHLRSALNYYNNAFSSPTWQSEIETMKEGFKRYADAKPLKFALIDSKLVSADLSRG